MFCRLLEEVWIIIPLMKLKMKEGILSTLVQFYDAVYRCFTFLDYQLMPTLEEYSYLLDLLVIDRVPFTGLEGEPKPHDCCFDSFGEV